VKVLLRSTFRNSPSDDKDSFLRNAQALRASGVEFPVEEDEAVWSWIQDFVSQYRHVPDASTVRQHFTIAGQLTVVDRFETVAAADPKIQGDFLQLLERVAEDRRLRLTSEILKDASQIAVRGLSIKEPGQRKEVHLRGPVQALQYVVDRAGDVTTPLSGVPLSGNATTDGDSFKEEYERVEEDPIAGLGQFSGIEQMDVVLKGAKRQQMWLHAAFTGGLKSTLAVNWIYNQAIYYRHSSVFISLEMPYAQVRRMIYAIHTCHPKFRDTRRKLGIKKSLDYTKMRDAELSAEEKTFLFDYVVPDLMDTENLYGSMYIEVADALKADFNVNDLRSKAELRFSQDPSVRMVVVDHAGLMSSRNRHNSTTERLNEVLRDIKKLSMSFNQGLGIAMLVLFQISREGFKSAEKNGGRYNLTHLSYANEAERSSDIVTASWVDDQLEESNLVKIQHLKAREDAKFKEFYAGVLWPARRIFTTNDVVPEMAKKTGDKIDLGL